MASFDIRQSDLIDEIVFANECFIRLGNNVTIVNDDMGEECDIYESDIDNLIKALRKAQEVLKNV